MSDWDEAIARKFREAERLGVQHEYHPVKRNWRRVYCPKCQHKIEYVPRPNWNGMVKCVECGCVFKAPCLDDFTGG
jgi:hypothetical protein